MAIAWPSFLMAGVLEMLVFALVDPSDLSWLGAATIALSSQAIYTLAFLAFWLIIAMAASLSLLLATHPEPTAEAHPHSGPG